MRTCMPLFDFLNLGLSFQEQDFELHLKLKTCYSSCSRISLGHAQASSFASWTLSQAQESLNMGQGLSAWGSTIDEIHSGRLAALTPHWLKV